MIDVKRACDIIEEHFPRAKPRNVYRYKEHFYLIFAPEKEGDSNDPIYLVNIGNGDYRFLNPLEDIEAFNEAIEKGPIKIMG